MKATELRGKSVAELAEELVALKKEQFSLRMQHSVGQLGQTHKVKEVRRNIARVMSVMNEKTLAGGN